MLRAVHEVLQPLGVAEEVLRAWLFSRAGTLAAPGFAISSNDLSNIYLPMFDQISAQPLQLNSRSRVRRFSTIRITATQEKRSPAQ